MQVDSNTISFFEPATGGNYVGAFHCGYDEGAGAQIGIGLCIKD